MELDDGEAVDRELLVASGDPTTLLDLIEEPFDLKNGSLIAGTVEILAEADRIIAIASRHVRRFT